MVIIFSHYLKKQTSVASPIGNADSKVQKSQDKGIKLVRFHALVLVCSLPGFQLKNAL